jgi:hypothetical protein
MINYNEKISILKNRGFKIIEGINMFLTAPHGNNYSLDYINTLNDVEFFDILKKERI